MTRHIVKESLVEAADPFECELDLQVAIRARVPVLISASPERALILTQSIASRLTWGDRTIEVVTHDVVGCGDFATALAARSPEPGARPDSILLLREIHALTAIGQSVLRRLMLGRLPGAPRVFASSSKSLHQYVKEGRFDPELFYYLNAIHIVAPGAVH
jgi:hypothetical protein